MFFVLSLQFGPLDDVYILRPFRGAFPESSKKHSGLDSTQRLSDSCETCKEEMIDPSEFSSRGDRFDQRMSAWI